LSALSVSVALGRWGPLATMLTVDFPQQSKTYGLGLDWIRMRNKLRNIETPFNLMNVLDTVPTFILFFLSQTVSFISEKPRSHSAVLPGNVSAAARIQVDELRLGLSILIFSKTLYH